MRILIAEDDACTARVLQGLVERAGWEPTVVDDGGRALALLQSPEAPPVALLDWMLPGGVDGLDICRAMRARKSPTPAYLMLLTARNGVDDIVCGLEAGADDYVVKPCNPAELRARLHAASRIVELQQSLARHVRELEAAMFSVKTLNGLLPICSYCKAIRDDTDYWRTVEQYVADHSNAEFTHGICPSCMHGLLKDDRPRAGRRRWYQGWTGSAPTHSR